MTQSENLDMLYDMVTDNTAVPKRPAVSPNYSTYEPSDYSDLDLIFDYISLSKNDTLLDYGCGLGRILFYCSHRFSCTVKGIEYDTKLYLLLKNNLEKYLSHNPEQSSKIIIENMAAEEYTITPNDNYFYFFNPFSTDILETVLKKIMASFEINPRKITIIFYYCTYKIMSAMRQYNFNLDKIIKLKNYDTDPNNKAYIYTIMAGK